MKKIILALTLFTYLLYPSLTFAATLTLSPASATFVRGCSYPVAILVNTEGKQVDGVDAILDYDPSRLTTTQDRIANGTVFPEFITSIDESTRKITIGGVTSVAAFSGSGTFATINFTVPNEAPTGTTQLTFDFDQNDKTNTRDSNVVERATVVDLLSQVTNGSYTIAENKGSCATGASPSTAPAYTTPRGATGPQATDSAQTEQQPIYKQLPKGGIFEQTIILATVGTIFIALGIIGLSRL